MRLNLDIRIRITFSQVTSLTSPDRASPILEPSSFTLRNLGTIYIGEVFELPVMDSDKRVFSVEREDGSQSSSVSPFTGSRVQETSPDPPLCPARQSTLYPRSTPPVIPPEHEHRTLVLCFDGTGDQFDADNSNIVQLVSLLKKNDRNKQMMYYQVRYGLLVRVWFFSLCYRLELEHTLFRKLRHLSCPHFKR